MISGDLEHTRVWGADEATFCKGMERITRKIGKWMTATHVHVGMNSNCAGNEPTIGFVALCPMAKPIVVFEDNAVNAALAAYERIDCRSKEPRQGARLTKMLRTAQDLTDWMIANVFTPEALVEAFRGNIPKDCRSKKWTEHRFDRAFEDFMVNYTLGRKDTEKFQVKHEPSDPKKAPRLILNDGDRMQVAALLVLYAMEKCMFGRFRVNCIKERSREEALTDIMKYMRKRCTNPTLVEADGSAWDTTMNPTIRKFENQVVKHIGQQLVDQGREWLECTDLHEKLNTADSIRGKTRAKMTNQIASVVMRLPPIRRSGHRGTSVLNWYCNFIVTLSTYLSPKGALSVVDSGHDVVEGFDADTILFRFTFEGDDSLVQTDRPWFDKNRDRLTERYTDWGLNMKMFCNYDAHGTNGKPTNAGVVEFVGVHMLAADGRPTAFVPDIARNLANAGVCDSPAALDAVRRDDVSALAAIAVAGFKARALAFAGRMNCVSRAFDELAAQWHQLDAGRVYWDHEACMKTGVEDASQVDRLIAERRAGHFASPTPRYADGTVEPWYWFEDPIDDATLWHAMGFAQFQDLQDYLTLFADRGLAGHWLEWDPARL